MSSAQPKSILLIDDDRDVLESLADFLKRNGYAVLSCDNGKDGLRLAKKDSPALIILDLILPDIDGSDVAAELLQNPTTRNIPIIFLTAVMTKAEQEASGEFIANRCIVAKPCKPSRILELVKSHIGAA